MPEWVRSREMIRGPGLGILNSFWDHVGSKGLMVAAGAKGLFVQPAQAPPVYPPLTSGPTGSLGVAGAGVRGPLALALRGLSSHWRPFLQLRLSSLASRSLRAH